MTRFLVVICFLAGCCGRSSVDAPSNDRFTLKTHEFDGYRIIVVEEQLSRLATSRSVFIQPKDGKPCTKF